MLPGTALMDHSHAWMNCVRVLHVKARAKLLADLDHKLVKFIPAYTVHPCRKTNNQPIIIIRPQRPALRLPRYEVHASVTQATRSLTCEGFWEHCQFPRSFMVSPGFQVKSLQTAAPAFITRS